MKNKSLFIDDTLLEALGDAYITKGKDLGITFEQYLECYQQKRWVDLMYRRRHLINIDYAM